MRSDNVAIFIRYARDFTQRVLKEPRRSELLDILATRGPYAWRAALTDQEYALAVQDAERGNPT